MPSCIIKGLLLTLAAAATSLADDAPLSADRPIKHWVESLGSSDVALRKVAAEKISERCNEVGDALGWNPEGADLLERLQRHSKLNPNYSYVRLESLPLAKLRDLRNEARPLIPELLELLEAAQADCRETVVELLKHIGPDAEAARPALLKLIRTDDAAAGAAAYALAYIVPRTKSILPDLLEAVSQGAELRRKANPDCPGIPPEDELAIADIGAIGAAMLLAMSGRTQVELPALIEAMGLDQPRVIRATIITSLGVLEAEAQSAVPPLHGLLKDADPKIRRLAAFVILAIEGEKTKLPMLIQEIELSGEERDEFEKSVGQYFQRDVDTARLLAEDGPGFVAAAADTLELLDYGPPFLQRKYIRVLGDLGAIAKPATPALEKRLQSVDPETAKVARKSLERIHGNKPILRNQVDDSADSTFRN